MKDAIAITPQSNQQGSSNIPRLAAFRKGTSKLKFDCIVRREVFARDLEERVRNPHRIAQGRNALCGPAAFLYCVAKKHPHLYVQYILDLAEKGEASIGGLQVKPGARCLRATTIGTTAVDWVGLASLRDSENSVLPVSSMASQTAGITLPGEMAGWFNATGLFSEPHNQTNLVWNSSLEDLLGANQKEREDYMICLFVKAVVFDVGASLIGKPVGKVPGGALKTGPTPDHWVVLDGPVLTGSMPTPSPGAYRLMQQNNNIITPNLLSQRINFSVISWGSDRGDTRVDSVITGITTEQFLDYFYGYVAVK